MTASERLEAVLEEVEYCTEVEVPDAIDGDADIDHRRRLYAKAKLVEHSAKRAADLAMRYEPGRAPLSAV